MSKCPIDTALRYLGNKWTFHIIRDLFFGKKSFNEFLKEEGLYGGVLSKRLKELRDNGIIEKKVSDTFPVLIEYHLTEKGRALNKVLYELAVFGLSSCPEFEDFSKNSKYFLKGLENLKKSLDLMDEVSEV